ncbi:ATP-dependent zinc metalloprotease FtsH [Cardiobacteriales bacterium ML27]|uniref:ATP-dependent zinc metalloprotease FtsH n=2 Tax=Ostreibacterium oceani TaxID=2654998 RepID=A0A6N7F360_9GAMM|nr:ATP-dependent zinc metalloprotease FtsH [Ostreibacterium oceani]
MIVVVLSLLNSLKNLSESGTRTEEQTYSQFLDAVNNGEVKSAKFDLEEFRIDYTGRNGGNYYAYNPEALDTSELIPVLRANGVEIAGKERTKESLLSRILLSLLPILLILGIIIYFSRQMQGGGKGGGGAFSFGKSKARLIDPDKSKITFKDVAGIDEVKEELVEMVDYLKDPAKFNRLGGKIPRGVLMVGEPGTGKTLLAKAVAGEAKVPFFSISGSDFVEMFVGVGAARVRDMFAEAKKTAPCIIFIDEIDAVGRHRGAGMGGGNDEREQTLNQLLVEMDGFEGNEGIIVIAATNRADVLDKALLRPGRFDRQVVVPLPDIKGRFEILKVHMKKVPLSADVRPKLLARGTPGFSGAELANLVNEAALFAARRDSKTVTMSDFEKAKDKILMGAERRSMAMSEDEKLMTAYHEAGHAIVGRLMPKHDPVYKVTIIPRGRALGVTMFLPESDKYSHSKTFLESNIATLFGGRIAEALIYGEDEITTGASNDIARATTIARNMVERWGLSDKLGPQMFTTSEHESELKASGQTLKVIDEEIHRILDENYHKALTILQENLDILHEMAKALMKYETIDVNQIDDLMERRAVKSADDYDDDDSDDDSSAESAETDTAETDTAEENIPSTVH